MNYLDISVKLDEETTSSAISYVPGRIGVVGGQLRVETETGKYYSFEEFEKMVNSNMNKLMRESANNLQIVKKRKLVDSLRKKIVRANLSEQQFKSVFPKAVSFDLKGDSLVSEHTLDGDFKSLLKKMPDDLGELDIIEHRIEKGKDFSEYLNEKTSTLYKVALVAPVEGINITYIGELGVVGDVFETISISDAEIVNEVSKMGYKVRGNTIASSGKRFSVDFYRDLYDLIINIDNKE